ncbi:MAG TPA: hypothetical protein VF746_09490 [Longimicrobium sp.]
MSLSHRSFTAAGLSLFGLAVVFAACTDDGGSPVGPQPVPPGGPLAEVASIECRANIRGMVVVCKDPSPSAGGASAQLLGNQNVNVRLTSSNIAVFADTFAFDVVITNVLPQPDDGRVQRLGVDSMGVAGEMRVGFSVGPVVLGSTGGSMDVANEDGTDIFTYTDQPYFTYNAVLDSGQTSPARRWKLRFDPQVQEFFFRVMVKTPLSLPNGWVNVEPDSSLLAPGETVQLTGTPKNFMGVDSVGTIAWSSNNTAVATVDPSSGLVTGVGGGTAIITATAPVAASPVNRTGTAKVVVVVPTPPATLRGDTIDAITNVTVGLPAPRLKTKITDPDNNTVILTETVTTAQGGVARIDSSGAYDYLSPAGFPGGQDSFRYHVNDGGRPDSATVVVNVASSNYWYVQAGASGDGRDRFPFGSLASAVSAAATGDSIFVLANGVTQLDGPGVLKDGQALIGQGIPTGYSTTLNGQTVTILAAGAAPGLTRTDAGPTITLAQNNTVRGVGITAADGAAILGSNFGTLTASDLGVNPRGPALDLTTGTLAANFALLSSDSSNTTGISLDGVGGTLSAAGGLIRHPDGIAFRVNGGSLTFSYPGRIQNTLDSAVVVTNLAGGAITLAENVEDAGGGIVVAGLTGGSVTFADSISLTGKGIDVHNNTAGAIAFNGLAKTVSTGANAGVALASNSGASVAFGGGGLVITTTGGAGFSATGGGLVSVTGALNTVATGTGTAVTLDAVNTGGSGVVFHSVSANGAVNGIKLTGVTGAGFQVTGDAATPASGGTIQSTTGHGVELSTLSGTTVALRFLDVTGAGAGGNAGIFTSAVDSLVVQAVNVSATGGPALSLANSKLVGTFASLSSANSASSGLILNTVSGTFSAAGGSITNPTGTAVAVIGGTVSMSYAGSITQPNAAALLSVTGGHSAGTLAFGGALSATNGTGLQFDNADGTYNITGTTTLNGGDAGIDVLNGSAGTFDIAGSAGTASITNPTDHAVRVLGSAPAFTYGGTLTKNNNINTGILVQNNTGGTIAFTGSSKVVSTGTGVAVNVLNNTGATISFGGGGLAITTTTGAGLAASGGGTLQVTGANNTAASTGGTPVSLSNIALGASGVTFHSVSATGGTNGILLSSLTGGGFQVTGDGVTGGSGGSISGTSGHAVSLSVTVNTALNFMNVTAGASGNAAVFGLSFGTLSVNGTTLAATSGPALNLGTGTLNGTFASIGGTLSGAIKGVLLNTVAGSFTVSGGTLAGGTDSLMVVRNGTVSATWQGNLTQNNQQPLLAVVGHATGTLTFSGTVAANSGTPAGGVLTGLLFHNADGSYAFNGTTTLQGGGPGIEILQNSDGVFTFAATASVSNRTAPALRVLETFPAGSLAGNPAVVYAGSISQNATSSRPVHVEGVNGDSVVVTGGITSTHSGILVQNNSGGRIAFRGATKTLNLPATRNGVTLTSNTGATVEFTGGGLAITTSGTGKGFDATGGGTVIVAGAGNTITAAGAEALNVVNTTIGSGGLTFQSISANGGVNGIVLNNTGSSGGLVVAGNGGSCSIATPTCTGGLIQNTTGSGVQLTSTSGVSLTRVRIQNSGAHGIDASAVAGLTLNTSYLETNGNGVNNMNGLNLVNVTGTALIDATTFRGAAENLVQVANANTNLTFTVQNGSVFEFPNPKNSSFANSAIQIRPTGTSVISASVQGSTFKNIVNTSFDFGSDPAATTTHTVTFSNNTLSVDVGLNVLCSANPQCRAGLINVNSLGGTTNFVSTGNTFTRVSGDGVYLMGAGNTSTLKARVETNNISSTLDDGFEIGLNQNARMILQFNGNTLTNIGADGWEVASGETNAANGTGALADMDLVLTNNTVNGHTQGSQPFVGAFGVFRFGDADQLLCLAMTGNTVTGTPSGFFDVYLDGNFGGLGGTMTYERAGVGALTAAEVVADNPGVTLANVAVSAVSKSNGALCQRPGI